MKKNIIEKNSFFKINSILNKKKAILLFVCNAFVLLNTNNVLSIEKNIINNNKNINLSKNARKFEQTREKYDKSYSDIMAISSLTDNEKYNLQLIYDIKLKELYKKYPNSTIADIEKEKNNLENSRKENERELGENWKRIEIRKANLRNAESLLKDGIILTPLYRKMVSEQKILLQNEEKIKKQLLQNKMEIYDEFKKRNPDYELLSLLKKIKDILHIDEDLQKQIKTVTNDPLNSFIVKEKCLGIKALTEQIDCQYNVITDLLDKKDRFSYFRNELSQDEIKEIEKFKLKYKTAEEIFGGSSLLTFGNEVSSSVKGIPLIMDYMNIKCDSIINNVDKELCKSNFVDDFIKNGEVGFTKDGDLIINNMQQLKENMGFDELIQNESIDIVKNNFEKTTETQEPMLFAMNKNNIEEITETEEENNSLDKISKEEIIQDSNENTITTTSAEDIQVQQQENNNIVETTETVKSSDILEANEEVITETQEPMLFAMNKNNIEEITETEEDTILNKDNLEEVVEIEESIEPQEQPSTPILPRTMMMRSSRPRTTINNQLSLSQQAQLKTISYINNNVDKVRYINNKRLNTNIRNTFKDNIINDGKNIGNINDSMWYSINMDMSNDRDDLTKSSNGSTLINFGYNFNYIDNIDSSVAISFDQIKSDLKMYSKDIPVNTYDFALSLFNKYDFGNDIVLSGMLSYNHNIVKDRKTKNIKYGYVDENADYIISSFTKSTHKKHYNDIALSLSVLYNYNILDNVKLTSGITADYFTTHKVNNALILSPMFEVESVNGFYHNMLFPAVYVKYNANTNNKNIRISDNRKVNLDKNNMEYGIKTKVGLTDKANVSFTYSGDSNRNNNIGASVGVEF